MEPALPEWMRAARRLAPETLAALFAASRRVVIETRIAALPALATSWRNPANGDLVDTDTQWHTHHAGRSGVGGGRWSQQLDPPQAAHIAARLPGYMERFGYRA